ncbi:MAG: cadherin-like domain-containing protein [Actinomycetaceae bacterium]|nr:cadherin-like domain-containing protein [Actinomycetaceae bacterium]
MNVVGCSENVLSLNVGEGGEGGNADPTFRTNGSHIILNDAGSGLVWTVNNGSFTLVSSSSQWQKDTEQSNIDQAPQTKDAQSNECPIPAAGAQAEFGVRPGLATSLPVLTAAQDANPADTITIIPSDSSPSWGEGAGLGELSLSNNNQSVILKPSADTGSARFTYTMTDGSSDCAVSASASVSVHPDTVRTAPEFRAENGDSLKHLQVAPGTSVRFNGLAGWVDPDGDALYISSVTASAGSVAATPQGIVAYRADEDQVPGSVTVTVNVGDSHGDGVSSHSYTITVTDAPALNARSLTRTIPAGMTQTIDLSEYISGITLADVANARVEITSASVENENQASDIAIQTNSDAISLTVTPLTEGIFPITYKVDSANSQASGTLLINSHKSGISLSVPPLTAFVRLDEEVTIDPLALASNPTDSVLIVKDPETSPVDGGALSVGVIGGSSLRIAGQTANGQAGRVGTITYTVTDGENNTTGQVTVFELDETASTKPVTVPDQVTVRAGEQVDIPVLANDVPAAGTTLTLDSSYKNETAPGLVFASDTVLRYLAPDEPGNYTLFYRAYALGHFDEATEGQVTVRVNPKGENRPPTAQNLSGRGDAHNSTLISVPTFGADPDGDDTFVTSVTQPASGGFTNITADGRIRVISTTDTGPIEFDYTLSDASGTTSTASVKMGVIEDSLRAPIAYNDYVEVKPGTGTVTLNPSLNDTVVANQRLVVDKVELKPSSLAMQASGVDTQATAEKDANASLKAKIGKNNEVTLDVPNTPGKVAYRYSLTSVNEDTTAGEDDGSKAEGIIVVNVTDQAQPIYPIVRDSVIGTDDISGDSFSVDVLADKTVWSGGDLRAELLSATDTPTTSASMSGTKLRGTMSNQRQTIPFTVTAPATNDGESDLQTWAFVKVPRMETIQPELIDSSKTYTVDQGDSISINLDNEIRPFSNRKLQVLSASGSGTREGARCSTSGNTVTYAAGDSPTGDSDACHVTVQWRGYEGSATTISLPIRIVLKDPPPVINSRQIAVVDPGETDTYDLTEAVTWAGQDKSRLRFECGTASGAQGVSVTCEGTTARIEMSETAPQGAVASFTVRVVSPSFNSGVPEGRLSVQVGTLAPLALNPAGTSVTINAGQSLSVTTDDLVALNNSLRHYGELSLVPGSASFSNGISGNINGGRVTVTASRSTQGGVTSGSVRIQDSQGNTGAIPISVTVNARPNTPRASLQSVGDGTVSILIQDNPTPSVPAVQGFTMTWNGSGGSGSKSCDAGVCTITGLQNFHPITVSITSTNEQGSSEATTIRNVYAYAAPAAPTITFDEPLPDGQGKITVKPGDRSGNQIAIHVGSSIYTSVTSATTVTLTGLPDGKANAIPVYAEAIASMPPPATLQQSFDSTALSNTVLAYSIGSPTLGKFSTAILPESRISAEISNIISGGDGVEWYWTVNGEKYGNLQHTTGKQSVIFPASVLKPNESNKVGIKVYSTDGGKRIEWASSEISDDVMIYQFPSSAENVNYSYDANGELQLNNTTSADKKHHAKLEAGSLNTSTCTAKIRWVYDANPNRVSGTFDIGPAPGSPCYPVSINFGNFTDWKLEETTKWTPTIYNLPKNRDDYDITMEVALKPNFPAGGTERLTPSMVNETTVEFKDGSRDPSWSTNLAPYYLRLTISFKNGLEGTKDIVKTITISK